MKIKTLIALMIQFTDPKIRSPIDFMTTESGPIVDEKSKIKSLSGTIDSSNSAVIFNG